MTVTKEPKVSLSENVMGMKFMRRRQESDLRKALDEESKKIIDENHWVVPGFDKETAQIGSVEIVPSHVTLEDLRVCGRRSFQNFNPEIEKLWKSENDKQTLEEAEAFENKNTVPLAEMAKSYKKNVKKQESQSEESGQEKMEGPPKRKQGQEGGQKGKRFYSDKNARKFLRPSE